MIHLSYTDLGLCALLVIACGGLLTLHHPALTRQLYGSALRCGLQLLLMGVWLSFIFTRQHWGWVALMSVIMLGAATLEAGRRQAVPLQAAWRYGLALMSMGTAALSMTVLVVVALLQADPWYSPRYFLPLLGMLLGNCLTGVSMGMDHFNRQVWQQQAQLEWRLALGMTATEAIQPLYRQSLEAALRPTFNMLVSAGVISLPGMMTGQILAGAAPMEAVKYQLMIMLLLAVCTSVGIMLALSACRRLLFDERQRLDLHRLQPPGS